MNNDFEAGHTFYYLSFNVDLFLLDLYRSILNLISHYYDCYFDYFHYHYQVNKYCIDILSDTYEVIESVIIESMIYRHLACCYVNHKYSLFNIYYV